MVKVFLILEIKKSVLKKLIFAKFGFFNLNKFFSFALVDQILIFLSMLPALAIPIFILELYLLLALLLKKSAADSLVIYNIEKSDITIVLKFLINFL